MGSEMCIRDREIGRLYLLVVPEVSEYFCRFQSQSAQEDYYIRTLVPISDLVWSCKREESSCIRCELWNNQFHKVNPGMISK